MVTANSKKELVLISGGAGFIGSHLVAALLKDGYRVRVLDNLSPPTHNGVLPSWFPKGAEFIKGDVRNKNDWMYSLEGVSYIFHLAAYMDVHPDISTYFAVNNTGTALLYEVINEQKMPIKKIIAASSQAVYGEGKYMCSNHGIQYPPARPRSQLEMGEWGVMCPVGKEVMESVFEKEDDELHPIIPYGISKAALESIVLGLGKLCGIPSVVVRYSIAHGSQQSFRHYYSGALRSFVAMALSGEDFVFHEDGMQTRDFVNIRDVTAAHLLLLNDPRADFQVFNIGMGKPARVIDLLKKVAEVVGVPFRPKPRGKFRFTSPRHSPMDISKLKGLGWNPKYTLDDNVRDYVSWVKNQPEAKHYFRDALA